MSLSAHSSKRSQPLRAFEPILNGPSACRSGAGFTLVELVAVIALFGLMMTFFLQRTDSLGFFQEEQGIRRFLNTWQFAFQQAAARGESYRLVVDLDRQRYWVLREVKENDGVARQVDYLRNLRSKGEQARRDSASQQNLASVEEELLRADERELASLERLFFDVVYQDPFGPVRVARPLEAPSLADEVSLPSGLRIRDIKLHSETHVEGQVVIRFRPHGGGDFALVHLQQSNGSIVTAMVNPSTGSVMLHQGDIDYEWTYGRTS